jgi:hypothetical protein
MTVAELIEKLRKYDEDSFVTVVNEDEAEFAIGSVQKSVLGGVEIRI